jgi:hypothetical protein
MVFTGEVSVMAWRRQYNRGRWNNGGNRFGELIFRAEGAEGAEGKSFYEEKKAAL